MHQAWANAMPAPTSSPVTSAPMPAPASALPSGSHGGGSREGPAVRAAAGQAAVRQAGRVAVRCKGLLLARLRRGMGSVGDSVQSTLDPVGRSEGSQVVRAARAPRPASLPLSHGAVCMRPSARGSTAALWTTLRLWLYCSPLDDCQYACPHLWHCRYMQAVAEDRALKRQQAEQEALAAASTAPQGRQAEEQAQQQARARPGGSDSAPAAAPPAATPPAASLPAATPPAAASPAAPPPPPPPPPAAHEHLQIVCMSATLPGMRAISRWLAAERHVADFRPVELRRYLVRPGVREVPGRGGVCTSCGGAVEPHTSCHVPPG